ncbi:MAG: Tm-1-like ATP-binding domain-containing protein [Candidatus Tectomicrobia bacterium]|uniref:Tm-1-like ATP-binding domain-containing protein n=1 Tax=Tectimicrobiota bacterium TaxID=2528274 RepID=A0A932I5F3_UNCTE|nr:Tm-1-like ATP-binding domain-containing protein [Candidatus Tectomicrobia bacterium]
MPDPIVTVLATLDSKGEEARCACEALRRAGAVPRLVDTSCRPHAAPGDYLPAGRLAEEAGRRWEELAPMERGAAADVIVAGGRKVLSAWLREGELAGVLGLGGANGANIACGIMRALPPLLPKVMVSPVAATAAVQWFVAESDIAMFPSIGDFSLNRFTRAIIGSASLAAAAMARGWATRSGAAEKKIPLVGVSSFGGTAACVNRVEARLREAGFEVILFHASGPGGRALESLARLGELAGVVDVTTHEMTDLLVGGVYSAGEGRLRGAGEAGIPQVVVPGALDHANFWAGQVPEAYRGRAFFRYNPQNLLMRTNEEEFEALGRMVAERLNAAKGPFAVLIPKRGYSEHTKRAAHDLEGRPVGPWLQPEADAAFARSLRAHLKRGRAEELDLHINDPAFADACADAFLEMARAGAGAPAGGEGG